MNKWLTWAVLVTAAGVASAAAARPASVVGRWRLNIKESEALPGEEVPAELIMNITDDTPTVFRWTVSVRMADGATGATHFDGAIDGRPRPVVGRPGSTSYFNWTPDGALKQVSESPGGLSVEVCTFSADMRRMDCDARQTVKDGHTWAYEEVFDRL